MRATRADLGCQPLIMMISGHLTTLGRARSLNSYRVATAKDDTYTQTHAHVPAQPRAVDPASPVAPVTASAPVVPAVTLPQCRSLLSVYVAYVVCCAVV